MYFKSSVCIYLFSAFITGTCLFIYGFYPISYSNDLPATFKDLPEDKPYSKFKKNMYKPINSRTVLMIIDALRFDFIYNDNSMKYTQLLLEEENACIFNIRCNTPTVTLPRIKAITSGTIPSFIDVVFNFGNPTMKIDTFIDQLLTNNGKIVFYGDSTWTQMFPGKFYRTGENRDGFFVNDFYEGDKNISKSLKFELRNRDWNMLILHYLGLDHIGHVEGPFSNKVPAKLIEMDNNIKEIHDAMKKWDKNSLFFITGDHGMRDSGGHGGSSYHETHVPLIVIGPNCTQSEQIYEQTDFATTISVLLGLPIPSSSIGSLIPELILQFNMEEQLYALHYSTHRILEKIKKMFAENVLIKKECYIQFMDAIEYHEQFLQNGNQILHFKKAKLHYTSASKEFTEILTHSFLKYDLLSIMAGIILNINTYFVFLIFVFGNNIDKNVQINFKIKYLLLSIITVFFIKHSVCQIFDFNSNICNFSFTSNCINTLIAIIFYGNILILNSTWEQFKRKKFSLCELTNLEIFLLISIITHTISYISSSFIEEEHQLWYYCTNTLFVLFLFKELKHLNFNDEILKTKIFKCIWLNLNNKNNSGSSCSLDDISSTSITFTKSVNRFYNKRFNSREDIKSNQILGSITSTSYLLNLIMSWMLLFVIHIFLRRLNQTGDKWLHLPDIGDWLIMDGHKLWLSWFSIFGLILMIFGCCEFGAVLTNILTFTAAILIYYYRTITESVLFIGIKISNSKTSLAIFWLNILEIICINYIPMIYKRFYLKKYTLKDVKFFLGVNVIIFCIISSLLHKPHNVILNAACIITCNIINNSCNNLFNGTKRNIIKILAHLWIGKLFFFYQGNSNSLASIDLNAGYVGLEKYNIVLVGIFLTINTYNGIILTYLILLYNLFDAENKTSNVENQKNISVIFQVITGTVITPLTLYLIIMLFFRNHIFIWTVFSPKIIYEFYHMLLIYIILFFTYMCNKCITIV